ncbi:MAG: tetratricopeptide (TPR) repeat protein [Myxococcota bacterium]|jgi:tetratricopeptide (TPR) repeat protein
MRNTALLIFFAAGLGATSTALAGTTTEDFGSVESITLDSAVTVPLYTTPTGGIAPCVQVMIGEDVYLFGLDTGHGIFLEPRVVVEQGLEPEDEEFKHFAKVKTTELESMAIGDLVLNNVVVMTQAPEAKVSSYKPFYSTSSNSGVILDGWIGLSTLTEVAWSIQPSTGQVIFAPLSEGPELVNSLKDGGEVFTWRDTETVTEVYGIEPVSWAPWLHKKHKVGVTAQQMIIPAKVGGADVEVIPSFGWWNSLVSSKTELSEADATRFYGDRKHSWLPVQIGSLPAQDSWVETQGAISGTLQLLGRAAFTQDYADGVVGNRVLSQLDIAADPTSKTIVFRTATEQKRESPLAFLLADATADTEEMPEVAEGEDTDPDTKPGSDRAWTRLADLQIASGDLTGAIASYQMRLEYDDTDKSCVPYRNIGTTQLRAGLIDDAITSLTTSSNLYHGWWDQDIETRKKLEEALQEYENDEEKAASEHADVVVQSGHCHVVDGFLAMAWLAQGDTEKVSEIYAEHLDLDDGLAVVQGNAALLDGNLSLARAAYYQAAMLEGPPDAISRLGQALVHDNAGDWKHAEILYRKALELNPYGVMNAQLWVDSSIRAGSAAATVRATERFLTNNPDSGAAYTAHARALRMAGEDAKLKPLSRRGDAFYEQRMALFPTNGDLAANRALFLVETNRLAAGQEAAETALISDPDATLAWLALGNIYVRSGDIARGEDMLRRAGQLGVYSPGYALLVNIEIPEPQPVPVENE